MRVLITGGAGFIGSHIAEHLQHSAEVRILDNFRTGNQNNLKGIQCELISGSILDRTTLRGAITGVDYVFHLAAMVSVPESMQNPLECNEINSAGTLAVLEESVRAGVKKLVFSSSAAIYGDNPASSKVETMAPEPKSPYAITKLDGEFYCHMFSANRGLPTACLRYFNVFGPRQDPKSQYAAAVPIFIDRAVRNEPITIYGDGEQTRDFVSVQDVVAANVFFATKSAATGTFNIGFGRGIAINELANRIIRLTGSSSSIQHSQERPGDIRHSVADIAKLRAAGFHPTGDFEDRLRQTVEHFSAMQCR